jgi:hypothetical protein
MYICDRIDNRLFVEFEGAVGEEPKQLFGEGKCPLIYYVLFT